MSEQDTQKEIKTEAPATNTAVKTEAPAPAGGRPSRAPRNDRPGGARPTGAGARSAGNDRPKREFKKNKRNSSRRRERTKPEFDQKMLAIRRVTRVSSGGRRFSFSVAMAIGDKKGKVGVGIGKAGDTTLAIEKAVRNGKKNMIKVERTKNNSIPHEVKSKYNSAQVIIMPAKGRGLIAGSAVRDLLELGGITDVNAKIISGSKNKLNIGKATIKALESLKN